MKIWILNKEGYIDGFSTIPIENWIELEVAKEPIDFINWRFDGKKLIHDPKNAPVIEHDQTSFQGNVMLCLAIISWALSYIPLVGKNILDYPKYDDIKQEYNNFGLSQSDMKTMVSYNRITKDQYKQITGENWAK